MARPKQQRIDVGRRTAAASGGKAVPAKAKSAPAKGRASGSKGRGRSGRPGGRPIVEARPATLGTWIAGARPQTLPLALAAVAIGYGAASNTAAFGVQLWDHWLRAVGCLVVAIALQIAVNYANDYSDGVRGTDAHRVGPQRLVGSGRARPRAVLTVALVFFAIAAIAGVLVVWRSGQWWLLAVGAVCIAAAWFYTGGKRPYGYSALGELAVFLFFGIVPVAGTVFVLTSSAARIGTVNVEGWLGGVAAGALACAVLVVNNLRDIDRDRAARKRTLAVLIGRVPTLVLYVVLMLVPFVVLIFFTLFYLNAGYVYFTLIVALPAIVIVLFGTTPRELVTALQLTLLTALLFGLGLGAALLFAPA
ncbi:1,4-dihydroxy-2-naphthoate polyprenyltransferase [Pseudolysinimonas kribbensis]|uniref:1,4-dihydroxy-2-naphthoate octaprenyltransferase n=1 Tax=Pseudolysinimonas kribbensis TaxID=433641 RepID=A0ABQ6K2G2_9MICO|nr:1,4-dihydroxy-2-naphthoate octaprenyltransferase [Pseudolysinimonas kribbensis]